jgi:cell division protein FtsZ
MQQAEAGLEELRSVVDTLITIPNERLRQTVARGMAVSQAFRSPTMCCGRRCRASPI